MHHPHKKTFTKDLPRRVVLFGGGGVRIVGTLEKGQNTHHPELCTRDVDHRFCGGGVWILRSDAPHRFSRCLALHPPLLELQT